MKKTAPKAASSKASASAKVPAKAASPVKAAAKAPAKVATPIKPTAKAAAPVAKMPAAVDRITPKITPSPAKLVAAAPVKVGAKSAASKVVAKAPAKVEKTSKVSAPAAKAAVPAKAVAPVKTNPVTTAKASSARTEAVKVSKVSSFEIGPTAPVPGAEALFVFENIEPTVDMGLFPAKREVGDVLEVRADVLRHFHEKFTTWFELRIDGGNWVRHPLEFIENDRWGGSCELNEPGLFEFRIGGTDAQTGAEGHSGVFDLVVDPVIARFGSWYTMWPRSQGTDPTKSATWDDCIARLPEIESMGFNVLYVPPVHPIGMTNRKGKNNNVKAQPGEPGCPYAIGSEAGGHDAVDPELGTMEDFERFIAECEKHHMQVALDIALNASPDHPYAKSHPDWFWREADGTIKYAENPPKKYEDIYAFHYFCEDNQEMWREFLRVHLFWISKGIRIFRIDNPHTKPFAFWAWLIREVKRRCPDAVFLAEAFTRPKVMKHLAKMGFQQSYTYFVWRESAKELREYVTELTTKPVSDYMRGNFFTNTPDINPHHCQDHGRPAFLVRTALAALLLPSWGMYNSWELCEATPVPGKEEYLDSEKYQYKTWDWNRPGHIKDWIRLLNELRNTHPALQEYDNITFLDCSDPQILAFTKVVGNDKLLCVVNCDPTRVAEGFIDVPWSTFGIDAAPYHVTDLVTRQVWVWGAGSNYVRLDPNVCPAHVLKIG